MPTAPFAWTHEKTHVEYDGRALTINDKHLPLDQIDRMSRNLSRSTAQGSWNRLDCGVSLSANGVVSSVKFRGDASTEDWGPWRPLWDQFDAFVRDEIEPRLVERTIRQVADDSFAEVGSGTAKGRGRFVVKADCLQVRKLFSKPIAWTSITEISDGDIQIIATGLDGKQHKHNTGVHTMYWNAWQVPYLWHHYGAR